MTLTEFLSESVSKGRPKPVMRVDQICSDISLDEFVAVLESIGYKQIPENKGVLDREFRNESIYKIRTIRSNPVRILVHNPKANDPIHEYIRLVFDSNTRILKYVQRFNVFVGTHDSSVEELIKYLSEK